MLIASLGYTSICSIGVKIETLTFGASFYEKLNSQCKLAALRTRVIFKYSNSEKFMHFWMEQANF